MNKKLVFAVLVISSFGIGQIVTNPLTRLYRFFVVTPKLGLLRWAGFDQSSLNKIGSMLITNHVAEFNSNRDLPAKPESVNAYLNDLVGKVKTVFEEGKQLPVVETLVPVSKEELQEYLKIRPDKLNYFSTSEINQLHRDYRKTFGDSAENYIRESALRNDLSFKKIFKMLYESKK